jgi:hypothetical protein
MHTLPRACDSPPIWPVWSWQLHLCLSPLVHSASTTFDFFQFLKHVMLPSANPCPQRSVAFTVLSAKKLLSLIFPCWLFVLGQSRTLSSILSTHLLTNRNCPSSSLALLSCSISCAVLITLQNYLLTYVSIVCHLITHHRPCLCSLSCFLSPQNNVCKGECVHTRTCALAGLGSCLWDE